MYITRKEAIKTIYDIMNFGILSEELENALQDIANCIEHENDGLFLWGADGRVCICAVKRAVSADFPCGSVRMQGS